MYEVRATKLEEPTGNVVGLASMVVDNKFAFNSIKIIKNNDESKGLFVSMPSYRSKSGEYIDFFHPTTKEMYAAVQEAVLLAYASGQTVNIGENEKTNITTYVEAHDYENSKGRVTMFLDKNFVCNTIHVKEDGRNEGNLFVAMPSYQAKDGTYKSYCNPVSKEFYEEFNKDIMQKYEASVAKAAEKYQVSIKPEEKDISVAAPNVPSPNAPSPSVPKPTSR